AVYHLSFLRLAGEKSKMQGRITTASVLCLGLLAACGGGSEQPAKPATSTPPAPAPEARTEAPAPKKPPEPVVIIAALPDTAGVVADVRLEGGKVSAGGRDSGKVVAARAAGFTVEAVFTPEETQSAQWAAIATCELGDAGFAVQQYADRNNHYYIGIAGKPGGIPSTPVAVTPTLTYLVFSMSEGKLRAYVNGVQKAVDT